MRSFSEVLECEMEAPGAEGPDVPPPSYPNAC